MQQQKQAAPSLRFSEFRGEWKKYDLGKLLEISSASRVHKNQWRNSGVPFFRTSDVMANFNGGENKKVFISEELFRELSKKYGPVKKNDLLVTGGGSIGIPYLIKSNEPIYFKDADLLWLKNAGRINEIFLYSFFLAPVFRKYLKSITHTGTISHYTIEQAKATPITIPSETEQQKIAEFLGTIDEKITQLQKKKNLLEDYKKGCMQKLFSQEFRFTNDNGNSFLDWKEKKLGDLGTFRGGGTPSTSTKHYWSGNIPWVSSSDILEDNIHKINISRYISETAIKESATKLIPANTILLVSRVGVGKFAVTKTELCTSQDFSNFTPNNANALYIAYWLTINKNRLLSASQGTSIKGFTNDDLKSLRINLPHLDEQKKIADFLSTIDNKITLVSEELDKAQIFKKGLLQQMFV